MSACRRLCSDPLCAEAGCLAQPAKEYRDLIQAGLKARQARFGYEALRHAYLSRRERWCAGASGCAGERAGGRLRADL